MQSKHNFMILLVPVIYFRLVYIYILFKFNAANHLWRVFTHLTAKSVISKLLLNFYLILDYTIRKAYVTKTQSVVYLLSFYLYFFHWIPEYLCVMCQLLQF